MKIKLIKPPQTFAGYGSLELLLKLKGFNSEIPDGYTLEIYENGKEHLFNLKKG